MPARIRILDAALADQIAAGEVVERPASVVKELIENALDADASRIVVEIEQGGQALVRVSDDGGGMLRADAELCVQRHATSKIASREDLFSIRTLGFRGEALPSIASVSRFTLTTRPEGELAGARVTIDGGEPARVSEHGRAKGTTIEVRDLFYNVPARLKFLKSKPTESAHVSAVCLRAALAHPGLALTLVRDGRTALELPRARDRVARVRAAFPDETLVSHESEFDTVRMHAVLGAPERARSGALHLHLYVNGRPVRDTSLSRAVAYAYGSVLPPGRYPCGAVYLELDPTEVDVNVHPQKLEVRFARGRAVLDGLTRALARQLGTSAWSGPATRAPSFWRDRLGDATAQQRERAMAAVSGGPLHPSVVSTDHAPGAALGLDPWGLRGRSDPRGAEDSGRAHPDRVAESHSSAWPAPPAVAQHTQHTLHTPGFFAALRPLGQAHRMFLVCEGEAGLYILDQHAADERVRFDRLRRGYATRTIKTQQLLFPERVECTELEALTIEEHHAALSRVGLSCSRLGPTTVAVAAVPALLHRAPPARLLRDVLAELGHAGERAFADAVDMALATMACHGAIRAGDALASDEITALLRALDEISDFQGHCPHGRPIVSTLPWTELEHRLGR